MKKIEIVFKSHSITVPAFMLDTFKKFNIVSAIIDCSTWEEIYNK